VDYPLILKWNNHYIVINELDDIECGFEISRCGWTDPNKNTWILTNSTKIDPGHDHTCTSSARGGHFTPHYCQWLSTVSDYTGSQEFVLYSPKVGLSKSPRCLSFWYRFFDLSLGSFEMFINQNTNLFNATKYWEKRTPQSSNWQHAFVTIPPQLQSYYVLFRAKLNAKFHDAVGLDDIEMTSGRCPEIASCDFEYDDCSWQTNGMVKENGTDYVDIDHTWGTKEGHYLVNAGPGNHTLIAGAGNLTSQYADKVTSFCLKFYYFITFIDDDYSDSISYIQVQSSYYNTIIKVQDAAGDGRIDDWYPFYSTISYYVASYNKTVTITVYTKSGTKIAIDDIHVQGEHCEIVGECNFENDMCGWENTYKMKEINWIRNQAGNQGSLKYSPRDDTTTHSPEGWYLMVPAEYLRSMKYFITPTLTSPPLHSSYYNCFSFNYYAIGTNSITPVLSVAFIDLTRNHKIIESVNVNTSTFEYWAPFRYKMPKMPKRYAIRIKVIYSTGVASLRSDIAIDDIEISRSDCTDWRPSRPSTTPIPKSEKRWNCDFEISSNCNQWTWDSNWSKTSFREVESDVNAPRSDKTYKTADGHYLLWLPPNSTASNQTIISEIKSSIITTKLHCFSFWYFDSSEILFQIDIFMKTKNLNVNIRSVQPNFDTRSWKFVEVDVEPYYNNTYISLRVVVNSNQRGVLAIDNIDLRPMACSHLFDYVYTFDSLDTLELSRITPLNGYTGVLHYPYMTSYPSAPKSDHTTGKGSYFLFMNKVNDMNTTYQDELVINNIPKMGFRMYDAEKSRCIRFAYQSFGNASLELYVSPIESNDLYASYFHNAAEHIDWVVAQVSYKAYYDHKVTFLLRKQFDLKSYIAIDDLSVSFRACEKPVECDFDDDLCSYTMELNNTDFRFGRFVGPPHDAKWPGPPYDHTKRGFGGGYLYLTGYPSNVDTLRSSVLQTPIQQLYYTSTDYCLSFWTYMSQPDAKLEIAIELAGGSIYKDLFKIIGKFTNLTETKWTRKFVNISSKDIYGIKEISIHLSGTIRMANTILAIDDIELSHDSCKNAIQFRCDNGNKLINTEQVCNFYKDCADGTDELNCGTCDFESGECGWISGDDDEFGPGTWNLAKAGVLNGPSTDGNGNSNGHYLMILKKKTSKVPFATTTLTRDYTVYKKQFKDAYYTCKVTYDYFISSHMPRFSFARITVKVGNDENSAMMKNYLRIATNKWEKGTTYIEGYPGSFVILFEGTLVAENETIALDNIQFQNCSIPPPLDASASCPSNAPILCQTTRVCIEKSDMCDFENNCGDNWDERYSECVPGPKSVKSCAFQKTLEDCGFSTEIKPNIAKFNWYLTGSTVSNPMYYSGPASDHTTRDYDGQFLVLRTMDKNNLNQKVRLYTPFMTSEGDDCHMRFFYYNNGNTSLTPYNELRVWVQYADGSYSDSGRLFTSNQYLASWLKAKVRWSSSSPFRYVFEAELQDIRASISLDDVSFYGSCWRSDAKRTNGYKSSAVTVVVVLLVLALVAGGGFIAYRRYQSGQLQLPFLDRFVNPIPASTTTTLPTSAANDDHPIAFQNDNHVG
ncbi:hypothetical protein BLOT_008730, partial [Blomia tropicalis]